MEAPQIAVLAIFGTLLALFGLWLFLIAPKPRKKAVKPFLRPYAHRGLWGEGVPENSLAAFRRSAGCGFAIELDVQLSRDGVVMVFHDYTLNRMCARDGKLSELTAAELSDCRLADTEEKIPTLREVLDAVAGRVPLLIELKGESGNTALCPAVLEVLSDYVGEWCVESFNPLLLRWFKKNCPRVVRGLLSTDLLKEKREGSKLLNFALSALLLTFLCRPSFHAFDQHHPRRLALRVGIGLLGAAPVVYTVRDPRSYERYLKEGVTPIFEGFEPEH